MKGLAPADSVPLLCTLTPLQASLSVIADKVIDFVETEPGATKDEAKLNLMGDGMIDMLGNIMAVSTQSFSKVPKGAQKYPKVPKSTTNIIP